MSDLANELRALCVDECRNRIDYRCAACRGADSVARLAEAEQPQRVNRINLIAWVLRNMDQFGCFSGDCPHDLNSECIESIVQQYEEDEAAKGGRDGETV